MLQQQVRPQRQHRRAAAVVQVEEVPVARCIADIDRRVVQRLRAVHEQVVVLPGDQHRTRAAAVGSGKRHTVLQMQSGAPLLTEIQRALIGHAVQRVPETAVGLETIALVLDHAI